MAKNKENALQGMSVDRGGWSYDDASETGHVEIELPSLPGSYTPTERLHVREFGVHVAGKIESFMNQPGYLSAPGQNAAQVFKHYTAVARGANLMDGAALGRMEALAKEFEAEPEQREYFSQVVKPYLNTLTPRRRQS